MSIDHSAHTHEHHHHFPDLSDIDITTPVGLMAVFSASILLSVHCAGMCGPLVCAALGKRSSFNQKGLWLYNLGRLLSYTATGAIVGGLTSQLAKALPNLGSNLAALLGGILIILGLSKLLEPIFKKKQSPLRASSLSARKHNFLGAGLTKIPTPFRDFTLGLVTVFLPCMTLSPVIGIAAASQSALNGALLLFVFALGTLPIMLTATNVPTLILRKLPRGFVNYATATLLLVAGIITIIRVNGH